MKIILIVMDTLRADHLGCYGYCRGTSPRFDALAAEGVLFERCLSNTAHTMPSFTTIITGQLPFTHDIVSTLWMHPDEPDQVLGDTHPVLAEQFRNAGRLTAAFDNLLDFGCVPKWFARGYDFYVNTVPHGKHCSQVLGSDINERLLPWLKTYADRDFFLFVHYWDTHQGYNQPEPFRSIHRGGHRPARVEIDGRGYLPGWGWEDRLPPERVEYLDLYDGEISYADSIVARVLDALRDLHVYDDTWIFLTADHGEDLEEHNSPFEHREPYETTCHVPLIVKPPASAGVARGLRVRPMVAHTDLMPTILEIASLPAVPRMDGVSLVPLVRGRAERAHDHTFLDGGCCKQRGHWVCPEMAVTTETHKYLRRRPVRCEQGRPLREYTSLCAPHDRALAKDPSHWVDAFNALPREELYNLAADPCETRNVVAAEPGILADLRAQLDHYIATNPRRWGA